MAQIKWTPQSLDDIEAIANFTARDSSYYARMFTTKVFEADKIWRGADLTIDFPTILANYFLIN